MDPKWLGVDDSRGRVLFDPDGHLAGAQVGAVEVSLGERPASRPLTNAELEATQLGLVSSVYEFHWIFFSVGILRHSDGPGELKSFWLDVVLPGECIIRAIAPKTEFITLVDGTWVSRVAISAKGAMSFDQAASAKAEAATTIEGSVNLSFRVMSPSIQATGEHHYRAHWVVERHKQPLLGSHQFALLVAVPRGTKSLATKCSIGGALQRTPFQWSAPLESWSNDVSITLVSSAARGAP